MVAINSNCKENNFSEIFDEEAIQNVMAKAKEKDQ